nr:unnamed protein product [Naegleria fowleri]
MISTSPNNKFSGFRPGSVSSSSSSDQATGTESYSSSSFQKSPFIVSSSSSPSSFINNQQPPPPPFGNGRSASFHQVFPSTFSTQRCGGGVNGTLTSNIMMYPQHTTPHGSQAQYYSNSSNNNTNNNNHQFMNSMDDSNLNHSHHNENVVVGQQPRNQLNNQWQSQPEMSSNTYQENYKNRTTFQPPLPPQQQRVPSRNDSSTRSSPSITASQPFPPQANTSMGPFGQQTTNQMPNQMHPSQPPFQGMQGSQLSSQNFMKNQSNNNSKPLPPQQSPPFTMNHSTQNGNAVPFEPPVVQGISQPSSQEPRGVVTNNFSHLSIPTQPTLLNGEQKYNDLTSAYEKEIENLKNYNNELRNFVDSEKNFIERLKTLIEKAEYQQANVAQRQMSQSYTPLESSFIQQTNNYPNYYNSSNQHYTSYDQQQYNNNSTSYYDQGNNYSYQGYQYQQ